LRCDPLSNRRAVALFGNLPLRELPTRERAATVAWLTVRHSDFELLSGRPVSYGSSPGVIRTFCGRCGCALTYQHEKLADSIDVTIGSLDDPNRFAPTMEVWLRDKVSWQPTDAHLAHFPGSSIE
jgi:hypothetical protein